MAQQMKDQAAPEGMASTSMPDQVSSTSSSPTKDAVSPAPESTSSTSSSAKDSLRVLCLALILLLYPLEKIMSLVLAVTLSFFLGVSTFTSALDTLRSLGGPFSNANLAVTEQILTRFPRMPGEIRNMIYAATVNTPRLLVFDPMCIGKSRSQLPRHCHADLPSTLLVNTEAYVEVKKHVNIVRGAHEGNYDKLPWSYINPRYDTVFWDMLNFQSARNHPERMPGIQTLALHHSAYWFLPNPQCYMSHIQRLARQMHMLRDLKELLLVSCFCELKNYKKCCSPWHQPKQELEPEIGFHRHPCGFFDMMDDDTEKMLSQISADNPLAYYNDARNRVNQIREDLTSANEQMFPGTKLPKITMVIFPLTEDPAVCPLPPGSKPRAYLSKELGNGFPW